MKNVVCNICGKKFRRKKSQLKLSLKHYCSINCSEQGRRKGKNVTCFVCKKVVYKSLKDLKRSKNKKYFCSINCSNLWLGEQQRADKHPNWAGGMSSYKNLFKRTNSKQICVSCGKNDTRILCVHHIDKNRKNNNMQNLTWLCRNCHFLVHNYKKELKVLLKRQKI
ncbi:MAG: HNH endonuclease [Parcubacteria group bacterium]|nr:HNH endonuclease [Parcubacteria group bacterium]